MQCDGASISPVNACDDLIVLFLGLERSHMI